MWSSRLAPCHQIPTEHQAYHHDKWNDNILYTSGHASELRFSSVQLSSIKSKRDQLSPMKPEVSVSAAKPLWLFDTTKYSEFLQLFKQLIEVNVNTGQH